jgi:hypothetical protein
MPPELYRKPPVIVGSPRWEFAVKLEGLVPYASQRRARSPALKYNHD